MPAPFTLQLCGYRNGLPNTSDASQKLSVEIGEAFFERIGVPRWQQVGKVDKLWSAAMVQDLSAQLRFPAPHLTVQEERWPHEFEQYAHLRALQDLAAEESPEVELSLDNLDRHLRSLDGTVGMSQANRLLGQLRAALDDAAARRKPLLDMLGDESLLRLDIAVHRSAGGSQHAAEAASHLVAGLSLKWTLRTDRLQDPRIQGSKMASLRRGRMPHFAAVTMEPRPYMLGRLGGGTGDLDCVYHLHLPGLIDAVEEVYGSPARRKQRDAFRRMVDQGRLRDYDELVAYLATVWSPAPGRLVLD
ncbi:NgoMIV family type II restriction endonuclease [Kitasatospora sp. NPDC004289]